jgi:hypothetical protein
MAGIVAVLVGGVLIFFGFPKADEERRLLARYAAEDGDGTPLDTGTEDA